jgi:carbonic anhydrase
MQKLVRGVHLFQDKVFCEKKALFEQLTEGQSPTVLFIACSDSRLDPNLLTQSEPGGLFIIRNAGNIIPSYAATHCGEAGTIEFALAVLGISEIIVCGHSHCGAMKGVLNPKLVDHLPAVKGWLSHAEITQRVMAENYKHLKGDLLYNAAIQENVLCQIDNLKTHPEVTARLARGKLKIHAWVYKFETGEVYFYDRNEYQFKLLEDEMRPAFSTHRRSLKS